MISKGQWMVARKKVNDTLDVWLWVFIMMGAYIGIGWVLLNVIGKFLAILLIISIEGLFMF